MVATPGRGARRTARSNLAAAQERIGRHHLRSSVATPNLELTMKTLVTVPRRAYPATVREAAEEKLQNLAKYFDRIESLRAVLDRQRASHRVELVVHVGDGATLVVDSKGPSQEEAFEDALQRMKSLLVKHKRRLVQRHRRERSPNRSAGR
jgi:ribosomal subunit interface protein